MFVSSTMTKLMFVSETHFESSKLYPPIQLSHFVYDSEHVAQKAVGEHGKQTPVSSPFTIYKKNESAQLVQYVEEVHAEQNVLHTVHPLFYR